MVGNEQLQIGIYEQILAIANGFKVYPYVNNEAKYPFVALGEEYITPAYTKERKHHEVYHVIHTFSQSKNKNEINTINNKIIEVLSEPFPLGDGFYISDSKIEFAQTMIDPEIDGVFHGVLRFKYIISEE